ncbi:MAG: aldo/keto reductase [Chloroflexota bacterium]
MIRWALEKGFIVLPKSNNPQRIRENAEVFDFRISADDMVELDGLNENFITSWDPTNAP